jgi:hypothetical protein
MPGRGGALFTGGVDVNDFKSVAEAGQDRVGEFAEGLIEGVRRLEHSKSRRSPSSTVYV